MDARDRICYIFNLLVVWRGMKTGLSEALYRHVNDAEQHVFLSYHHKFGIKWKLQLWLSSSTHAIELLCQQFLATKLWLYFSKHFWPEMTEMVVARLAILMQEGFVKQQSYLYFLKEQRMSFSEIYHFICKRYYEYMLQDVEKVEKIVRKRDSRGEFEPNLHIVPKRMGQMSLQTATTQFCIVDTLNIQKNKCD